ncbi:protein of unknown function [Bacillus sp. OV194]|nr:protein of unknown function [Bacillus sp. OV194]
MSARSMGGSIYAAVDPMYMFMFLKKLGKNYIVWDKAASIQFKRPGRSTLYAKFKLTDEELADIKESLSIQKSIDRIYHVKLVDKEGNVHAIVEKTIYIKRKER